MVLFIWLQLYCLYKPFCSIHYLIVDRLLTEMRVRPPASSPAPPSPRARVRPRLPRRRLISPAWGARAPPRGRGSRGVSRPSPAQTDSQSTAKRTRTPPEPPVDKSSAPDPGPPRSGSPSSDGHTYTKNCSPTCSFPWSKTYKSGKRKNLGK